MLLALIDITKQ